MSRSLGYTKRDSILHRLNPTINFFALILIMAAIFIYPSWILSIILLVVILACFGVAGVSLKLSSRRIRFLVIFSLFMLVIQLLVTINGEILFFIIPQYGDIGPALPVTDYGLERGLILALRFLIIVFSSMLFISITDPTLFAHSLTRLQIPYRYAFGLVLALRFLPIFDAETDLVRMSQRSRGITMEVGSPSKLLRSLRFTFFPLLVSALSRIDTLANSMDTRGFGYRKTRTYLRESKWRVVDSFPLVLSILLLIFCILLSNGLLPWISAII